MQNINIIKHLPFASEIRTQDYNNPSYSGIVHNAFKKFLETSEIDQIENGYRRSPWSDEAFYRNFEQTNVPQHNVLKDEHYYKALDEMEKRFRPTHLLTPVHYADLRLYPWRLSTNIGAPYNISESWKNVVKDKFEKKLIDDTRLSKHNLYNEFFVNNRYLYHRIKDGFTEDDYGNDLKYWNTAFARLHLVTSDDPDKVRLTFGAPTLLLQSEMPFIWPIQISLLSRGIESPMLWGFETLKGGWYKLRNWFATYYPRVSTFFTFDWSSFDLLTRHTVIIDIHARWRKWFTFEHGYWPTQTYPQSTPEPKRLENLWKWMTHAVRKTPLLLPDGRLVEFLHSCIFSGYLQTQLLGSCYNMVMLLTILSRMGYDIEKVALKVQGDDSIGALHEIVPEFAYPAFLSLFQHYAELYFGAKLNLKKSELLHSLDNAEVLKYRNHGGIPTRIEFELLAMLRHPERSQSLPALMARSIGLAYANCGAHPRVYSICEDIHTYLKGLKISPNASGLPGVLQHSHFDDVVNHIDLSHFPPFFNTMKDLLDYPPSKISQHNWNTDHFIGTPT
jgi:hypothetical protein